MGDSKITEQARARMREKPRWMQRKEALLEAIEDKHREVPERDDVPDADDASIRREFLL